MPLDPRRRARRAVDAAASTSRPARAAAAAPAPARCARAGRRASAARRAGAPPATIVPVDVVGRAVEIDHRARRVGDQQRRAGLARDRLGDAGRRSGPRAAAPRQRRIAHPREQRRRDRRARRAAPRSAPGAAPASGSDSVKAGCPPCPGIAPPRLALELRARAGLRPCASSWPLSRPVSKLASAAMRRRFLNAARAMAAARMTRRTEGAPMIRILLAEDDEAMRTYLARALENAGYEVVAVDRGTAAAAAARDRAFRPAAVRHRHARDGRDRARPALRRDRARAPR